MVHTHLRKFTTRDTYPEQKLDNDLCETVVAGKTIYLRGQVPQDLETRENVAGGDPAGQAGKVVANIDLLLREAGSSLEQICKVAVYLIDIRNREAVCRVAGQWLKGVTLCSQVGRRRPCTARTAARNRRYC